jgi:zinc/manganese transport system substrate-binding protein
MKRLLSILLLVFSYSEAFAKLNVVTTYNFIADITRRIGGDRVSVEPLAPGNWDPHYIVPKPSYISKARKADLLIINGAELEIGWMPPIIRESNNPAIQPGMHGFLDLSDHIIKIQIPENVSRALGDVHPSGNPHFLLDPHNVPLIADAISNRLCALDGANQDYYRANLKGFREKWSRSLLDWTQALRGMKGVKVVQYHSLFDYLFKRFDIILAGEIEPLPGIPPSSGHIEKMIAVVKSGGVKFIIQDVYHPSGPAELLAKKTGAILIILPHDVSATPGAENIFSLFDEIVRRLTK